MPLSLRPAVTKALQWRVKSESGHPERAHTILFPALDFAINKNENIPPVKPSEEVLIDNAGT
jgi:hypothetical protein